MKKLLKLIRLRDSLDLTIIEDAKSLFHKNQKIQLSYNIQNTDRALAHVLHLKLQLKLV